VRPQIRQVNETVDLAKHVIVGDVPLEAEAVKQRLLHHPPLAHHRPNLLLPKEENQRQASQSSGLFQRNTSTPAGPFAQLPDIRRRLGERASSTQSTPFHSFR
jgi:hypothetical protein